MDPGADTNRTVVTFIGSPEDVEEAEAGGAEAVGVAPALAELLRAVEDAFHAGLPVDAGAVPFPPPSGFASSTVAVCLPRSQVR